jgi:hypothetical protein
VRLTGTASDPDGTSDLMVRAQVWTTDGNGQRSQVNDQQVNINATDPW